MEQAKEIPLELSKENLQHLLTLALGVEAEYSHFDIANWCSIHFYQIFKDDDNRIEDYNIYEENFNVLADIENNWDIHVHETRVHEPTRNIAERNIRLPQDWIAGWLKQLT